MGEVEDLGGNAPLLAPHVAHGLPLALADDALELGLGALAAGWGRGADLLACVLGADGCSGCY